MTQHGAETPLALLRRWGWNATGFQVLESGFSHYFDGSACVSYFDTGGAWVVAGAPIAPLDRLDEVARGFVEAARRARRRVCFFGVEPRFVDETGMPSFLIGEQASWNPRDFARTLNKHRSLREQLRRARAKGVSVRAVDANEIRVENGRARRGIEVVVRRWLATRAMPPMGFLVDVQLFDLAEERRYFVAERSQRVVGFLVAVPIFAREGWLFEDLLRDPQAPNGTIELLVSEAMQAVANEGSTFVTLGLAPLSGPVSSGLSRARRLTSALYDFDGVRAFKSKLRPDAWHSIHLAYPAGASPIVALHDVLAAFARGSLLGFGIRAFLRGPSVVVRILAMTWLAWAMVVAGAGATWFPTSSVHRAWIAFGVLVSVGMWTSSKRWIPWLGVAVSTAMTAAALLSIIEAWAYNLSRDMSLRTWTASVIACVGPVLGAAALWGAVGRQRRIRDAGASGG